MHCIWGIFRFNVKVKGQVFGREEQYVLRKAHLSSHRVQIGAREF